MKSMCSFKTVFQNVPILSILKCIRLRHVHYIFSVLGTQPICEKILDNLTIAVVKQLGKFARSLLYLFNDGALYERRLANTLLIYGECQKNQRQAATLYTERFFLTSNTQGTNFSTVYLLDLFNMGHYTLQHATSRSNN